MLHGVGLLNFNKLGFIDGTLEAPNTKKKPNEYALWKKCNKMIISWFVHSVTPELTPSVMLANTALPVWEDFREIFTR